MFAIYGEVCKKNLKIFLIPATLSSLLIPVILLVITDLRSCPADVAANLCQRLYSISGILLLSPIFATEHRVTVEETLLSKAIPLRVVQFIRLVEALITMALSTAGFIWFLMIFDGELEFKKFFMHSFATTLLLGGLGMACTRFSHNIGIGYMLAFGFYIVQQFFPYEVTRYFYIFTLKREYGVLPVYVCAAFLIVISFLKIRKRR